MFRRPVFDNPADKVLDDKLCAIAGKWCSARRDWYEFENLVSEGWVGALNASETFDLAAGLAFDSYRVWRAYHTMQDYLRRPLGRGVAARNTVFVNVDDRCSARVEVIDPQFAQVEARSDARKGWELLSSLTRRTMDQHFVDGVPVFEIAKRDGVTQSAVSQRITKALRLLRRYHGVDNDGKKR